MKVVEFRLYMPTTPEQYQRCQLYMVAKASLEAEGADGIQIVKNEHYSDESTSGQYTHKKISLASKLPSWLTSLLDSRLIIFSEHSWNAFPKLKTQYSSELFPKMTISVESFHEEGINTNENALNLPQSMLDKRKIVEIDIVNDSSSKDSLLENNFYSFRSEKAQIGPLNSNWQTTTKPIMTCYKVFIIDIPYLGIISTRVESWVIKSIQEQLLIYHKKSVFWMDEWFDLSMKDIRSMEDVVKEKLDILWSNNKLPVQSDLSSIRSPSMNRPEREVAHSDSELVLNCNSSPDNWNCEESKNEQKEININNGLILEQKSLYTEESSQDNFNRISTQLSKHSSIDESNLKTNKTLINHSGYIYKLGDGIWNTTWNKRYMIISNFQMWYYNDPRETKAKDSFSLIGAKISWFGELRSRNYAFQVVPQGKKAIYLSGETESDSKQWMEIFKMAAFNSIDKAPSFFEHSSSNYTETPIFNEQINKLTQHDIPTDTESTPILENKINLNDTKNNLEINEFKFEENAPLTLFKEESLLTKFCLSEFLETSNYNSYLPVGNYNGIQLNVKYPEIWTKFKNLSLQNFSFSSNKSLNSSWELKNLIFYLIGFFSIFLLKRPEFPNLMIFSTFLCLTKLYLYFYLIRMCIQMGYKSDNKIDIWGKSEFFSSVKYKVKATCVLLASPYEIFNYFTNSDQSTCKSSNSFSKKFTSSDQNISYIYEIFIPCDNYSSFNVFTLRNLFSPRELFKYRLTKSFTNGSYIITDFTTLKSKEYIKALSFEQLKNNKDQNIFPSSIKNVNNQETINQSKVDKQIPNWLNKIRKIFNISDLLEDFFYYKPIETDGFEILSLSPLEDGKSTLITFLTCLELNGILHSRFKEIAAINRAISIIDHCRTYFNQKNNLIYKDIQVFLRNSSNSTSIDTSFDNKKIVSVEHDFILKKRSQWPLEGMVRFKSGGLVFIDQAIIQKQKGAVLEILKSGSKSILEGKGIVGISLPVRIFEPLSLIEKLAFTWGFAPLFLTMAAKQTDPLERLKYTIVFAISSLHLACFTRKPFNPILGETYQGHWDDGSQIFIEHTSHHPLISHFLIEGPKDLYKFWGFYGYKGQVKGNCGFTMNEGPNILQTRDGSRIEWHMPVAKMSGIMWGQRIYEWIGNMDFIDKNNNLKCKIKFAYDSKSIIGKGRVPSEAFKGDITSDNNILCNIAGSWLDGVEFNGKRYWSFYDYEPLIPIKEKKYILPTDCRFREDAFFLLLGDEAESQKWKLKLEAKQRKERQMRHDFRKIQDLPEPYCT